MPKEHSRHQRMASLLKHELGHLLPQQLLNTELKKNNLITVSAVNVSADMGNAKIYVSCLREKSAMELITHLNKLAPKLRSQLAQKIHARSVPVLLFVHDTSLLNANHIHELLLTLHKTG